MTEVLEKMLGGVKFVIERSTNWRGLKEVTVKASATALRSLSEAPSFVLEEDAHFTRWLALDDQGREVASDYSLRMLQEWGLKAHFRELGAKQCRDQLDALEQQGASLRLQDFSTARFLVLFKEAREVVGRVWWDDSSINAAVSRLRMVERHIERIKSEPSQVLLEDILSGATHRTDHLTNVQLLAEVVGLSVRSGGRIELPADDILEELYALELNGASKVSQAQRVNLTLSRELFVPDGWQGDESIVWAPQTFAYVDGRKSGSFPISYGLGERDGKAIPMASLTIPLSLYENKRVDLPELPHDIVLHLGLTVEGKVVVMGFADQVAERVKKYKGGKRRGKQQVGSAFAVEAPTELPPWAKGKSAHVRRR